MYNISSYLPPQLFLAYIHTQSPMNCFIVTLFFPFSLPSPPFLSLLPLSFPNPLLLHNQREESGKAYCAIHTIHIYKFPIFMLYFDL